MIVLPNSFEIYLKNLRIYTSLSILKHGFLPQHLKNLKKIYLAEAFLYHKHTSPTDLHLLSFNLLSCVKSFKSFNFSINLTDKALINQKLFTVLLLSISKNCDYLKIEYKNGIVIKGSGEILSVKKTIHFLDGYSLFDLKSQKFLIYIPCKATTHYPTPTVSQWELIFDKFSPFNLFYN